MADEIGQEIQESQVDFREYLHVALKRKWTVLVFFVIVLTMVTIYTLRQVKIYEARASVIIEPYAPQVLGNVREVYDLGSGSYWSNREYYETQYNVITSRTVAQKIVQQLHLDGNKEFLGIDTATPEEQKAFMANEIDYPDLVRKMIEVEPVKESRTAVIKARHRYPKWAQRLANAAVSAYIEYNLQTRRQITLDAAGWLTSQAKELKTRMDEAEDRLVEFKREKQILSVSLEDRQNITSQRLQDMNQTLNQLQAQRIALDSRRKQILDIKEAKQPLDTIDKVIASPLVQQLKESYFKLQETQAELSAKYLPDHPKVISIDEKIRLVRQNINSEIDNVLGGIETEYRTLVENERALQRAIGKVKDDAQEINEHEIEYNRLKRVADNYTSLHQLVLKRQKEASLSAHQETNNIYKLDTAVEPRVPVYPRVKLNLLLAALVGLLGGIGLAFFLEFLDNTIKTQEDIEHHLQLPFLGIVPSIKLEVGEDEEVVPLRDQYLVSHPKSSVAECFRTVRTNLLFMSPENPARRMLITSASPQEGKSTVVINLGITMAQSGSKILLLDTDMRRPRLHKTFGIQGGLGLTTAILGEADVEKVIYHSDISHLDILPCGPIPPNPTELLHTERFLTLINQLSEKYDRLIFDSPPILVVADPLILSRSMDGIVLVIKSAQTSREIVKRAVRQMTDVKARMLGTVLNDIDLQQRDYGYYYYRQYGYYYGEKDRDVTAT